jgi:hypothetical protein
MNEKSKWEYSICRTQKPCFFEMAVETLSLQPLYEAQCIIIVKRFNRALCTWVFVSLLRTQIYYVFNCFRIASANNFVSTAKSVCTICLQSAVYVYYYKVHEVIFRTWRPYFHNRLFIYFTAFERWENRRIYYKWILHTSVTHACSPKVVGGCTRASRVVRVKQNIF